MHPNEDDLRRYLDGEMDEAESEAISAHLQACPPCLDLLQALSETGIGEAAEAFGRLPLFSLTRASHSASGRFRLLRFHKQGGLGRIYVAYDEELGREVALKEIRPDKVAEPHFRSRFVLEAEINGGLEHPGIVPVYSLGAYDDGRPFYAMRFVAGGSLREAIAAYHKDHPCPDPTAVEFRRLLGRFVDICDAIAFAHSRGVLHRDLKPGNVMLGRYGETLLIDWGMAKATGRGEPIDPESVGEGSLIPPSDSRHARTVGVLGSPPYMSPEQAAGSVDSLGPATDVYGLGAILFALLTAQPPVEDGSPDEVLDRARRGAIRRPRSLNPNVPRALEAICQKALSLRPEDRYPSARALADDVERWMADEPVSAWREPLNVRARRWARRNRTAVTSIAASILAGSLGSAAVQSRANAALELKNRQLFAAQHATTLALDEATEARIQTQSALDQSEASRRQAKAINDFLVEDLLAQAEPAHSSAEENVTLREVLDRAAEKVGDRFAAQPEVEDALRRTIARTYHGLGSWEKAESQWQSIHEAATRRIGSQSAEALTALSELAHIRADRGRRDPEILRMASTAAEGLERIFGLDHPDTLRSRNELAEAYRAAGRTGEAIAIHQDNLERRESRLGPDHPNTIVSRGNLAKAYVAVGRADEAISLHETDLELCASKYGPAHPATLESRNDLAVAYDRAGRIAEAIRLHEGTVELSEARLGPDHPETINTRGNLAVAYLAGGRIDEAVTLQEQVLTQRRAQLGQDHPSTLISRGNLAKAYIAAGCARDAVPLQEETLERCESTLGPVHPSTLTTRIVLASAYHGAGRAAEAIALYESTLKLCEETLGRDHRETLTCRMNLASAYLASRRIDEAIAINEETLKLCESTLGPDHPETLNSRNNLAVAYRSAGRNAEAIALHEQTLARREETLGADHPDTLNSQGNLASVYLAVGRTAEAVALHEKTLRQRGSKLGARHPSTLISRGSLAKAYLAAGLVDQAVAMFEQALEGFRAELGPDHPHSITTEQLLADAYIAGGQDAKAEPLLDVALERAIERFGATDLRVAAPMASRGVNLIRQRKWDEAEPFLRDCLEIRQKAQPDDWSTFNARSLLGGSLLGQKKYSEAEPLILSGYEGMKVHEAEIPTPAKSNLDDAAERIIGLYDAWGKRDEVVRWRRELGLTANGTPGPG